MPRLWKDTIEEHKAEVRVAILDAVASLVSAHGLHGVSMSALAEKSGVGRGTLYKYFPDLEAAVLAWHERIIDEHVRETMRAVLSDIQDGSFAARWIAESDGGRE